MPGYRGHLLGGLVTYLIILQALRSAPLSIPVMISGFVFCMIGCLFPDIDIKSKGQKLFYSLALAGLCYFLYCDRIDLFIAVSLLITLPLLVKHRGIFHKIWFLVAISVLTGLAIESWYGIVYTPAIHNALFFLAGALSHVFLDRTTTRFKYWLSAKKYRKN